MPGVKMDRKARMTSSTCSYVVYPRMHESMVIICFHVFKKIVATLGGASVGVC